MPPSRAIALSDSSLHGFELIAANLAEMSQRIFTADGGCLNLLSGQIWLSVSVHDLL